jgi:hypothetical protein
MVQLVEESVERTRQGANCGAQGTKNKELCHEKGNCASRNIANIASQMMEDKSQRMCG